MAGRQGRSGRLPLAGRLYRLNVRFLPQRHSVELAELLEMLASAAPQQRADILDKVAAGGGLVEARAAVSVEAVETEALLNDLFNL